MDSCLCCDIFADLKYLQLPGLQADLMVAAAGQSPDPAAVLQGAQQLLERYALHGLQEFSRSDTDTHDFLWPPVWRLSGGQHK